MNVPHEHKRQQETKHSSGDQHGNSPPASVLDYVTPNYVLAAHHRAVRQRTSCSPGGPT